MLRLTIATLFILLSGCVYYPHQAGLQGQSPVATPSQSGEENVNTEILMSAGTASASWASPTFGIIVEPDLRVVAVKAGSPAESAGMQIGDVLVDLRPADPSVDEGTVSFEDRDAVRDLVERTTKYIRPTLAPPMMFTSPLPPEFTAPEGFGADSIGGVRQESIPFLVRILRGEETIVLEMTPGSGFDLQPGSPTPTPFPSTFSGFIY